MEYIEIKLYVELFIHHLKIKIRNLILYCDLSLIRMVIFFACVGKSLERRKYRLKCHTVALHMPNPDIFGFRFLVFIS